MSDTRIHRLCASLARYGDLSVAALLASRGQHNQHFTDNTGTDRAHVNAVTARTGTASKLVKTRFSAQCHVSLVLKTERVNGMAACSIDILGRRCAKRVVALGASVRARRSRNWLMGWHCASRPGRSGRCSRQKPASNGLARCADHGQTDQLSHVIVCLSGSSDLGPAARWAVGRWWSGNGPRAALSNTILRPHTALVGSARRRCCAGGRRAGLGWIDTIGLSLPTKPRDARHK
ncbi:hypothetical protein ACVWXO_000588 [Bradyrhizobium sp. LM2.7]